MSNDFKHTFREAPLSLFLSFPKIPANVKRDFELPRGRPAFDSHGSLSMTVGEKKALSSSLPLVMALHILWQYFISGKYLELVRFGEYFNSFALICCL